MADMHESSFSAPWRVFVGIRGLECGYIICDSLESSHIDIILSVCVCVCVCVSLLKS